LAAGDVVPAVQFGVLPAQDQVTALLRRDPAAHVSLGDPYAVSRQLSSWRETGAEEQATALADRLPGQACSSSSGSKRAAKISSGLAGRLTAAQPSHGDGKTWTDVARLGNT
jgi:hypothetical protein